MAQTAAELQSAFQSIRKRAERGTWQMGPVRSVVLRLTTMESAADVPFDALEGLVTYSRDKLGVEFELVGGGTGCFDMILTTDAKGGDIAAAIENDLHFQTILNDLNLHLARLRSPAGTMTFAAHVPIKAGVVTNRSRAPSTPRPNLGKLFGSEFSQQLSFAMAEFHVLDLSHGQPRRSFAGRVWRAIRLNLGDIFLGRQEASLARIDLVESEPAFRKLVASVPAKGILACVHGYANSFEDALLASARLIHRSRLEQLDILPVIFSWPSRGKGLHYLPDVQDAANSQVPLGRFIGSLMQLPEGMEVNLLAHSHGCKILLEAICALPKPGKPRFSHVILVEPDVDAIYLGQRIGELFRAGDRLTLYHSRNDKALAISARLFRRKRAGQVGLDADAELAPTAPIEIIDASWVARGILQHSPHVDSIEVIRDIRDVLAGQAPDRRQHLVSLDRTACWQVQPA